MNAKFSNRPVDLSSRASGVLMHVTSLPGLYGIGDLGSASRRWVDLLAKSQQRWWQMLPLGPTGEGNSPYRSYSAFAGNPLLISPDLLVDDGLLTRTQVRKALLPGGNVNYSKAAKNKLALLAMAHDRFRAARSPSLKTAFDKFISTEAGWLDDYALFTALREASPETSWTQWPAAVLRRQPAALATARQAHAAAVDFQKFIQFVFFRQLRALQDYARARGVGLIGDLPIFVSPESVDVWTHPGLFQLDRQLRPRAVSGVPPDQFSATGQRWGNPLYDWAAMRQDGFAWWKARLRCALSQADLVRIDHFRGFEAYWRVPVDAPTAQTGRWVKAPGVELFEALLEHDSHLPLLAEDLGIITPKVEQLRDRFKLPGMRVLQFGFTAEPGNPHTPHNFTRHCFAYTGTHDNDTSAGWFKALPAGSRHRLRNYAPNVNWKQEPEWALIQLLAASTAGHVIVPLQDLLGLGSQARMNTPGESDHNWEWRLDSFDECRKPFERLAELTRTYERSPSSPG